jgi:hypothetical protein
VLPLAAVDPGHDPQHRLWVTGGKELGDEVLEIGPGPGATTEALRRQVPHLTAVEIDPAAVQALTDRFGESGVYPLGPLVFVGSFPVLAYAVFVVVSGRVPRPRVPAALRACLVVTGLVLLGLNWTVKLVWLGV